MIGRAGAPAGATGRQAPHTGRQAPICRQAEVSGQRWGCAGVGAGVGAEPVLE
jgi:hypothetical protein